MKKKLITIFLIVAFAIIFGILAMKSYMNSPSNDLEEWQLDGIQLMKHQTEGFYGCFGCNDVLCVDPSPEMKPSQETLERYCSDEFEVIEN